MNIKLITLIIILFTGIFMSLFALYVLYKKHRTISLQEFFVGFQKHGPIGIGASIAVSYIGGASLISMSSVGYKNGLIAFIDPMSVFLGALVSALFVKLYYNLDEYSIGAIASKNHKLLRVSIGFFSSLVYILFSAAQVAALYKFFISLTHNYKYSLLSIVLVLVFVIIYIYARGFEGVFLTDIYQFIILFIGLLTLFLMYLSYSNIINSFDISEKIFSENLFSFDASLLFYLSLSLFFVPVSYTIFTRVKAAKSIKDARIGVFLGGFFYFIILSIIIFIGILLKISGINIKDAEKAIFVFFENFPPFISVIGYIIVFTAIVSTLDTFLFNAFTAYYNDIFKILFQPKNENWAVKINLLLLSSVIIFIGLYKQEVLKLILFALFLYISILFPIIISRIFFPVSEKHQFISITTTAILLTIYKILGLNFTYEAYLFVIFHLFLLFTFWYNTKNVKKLKNN